ncbi:MAG: class II aldolase/adducin family protein [Burkholderiaceae bacterium]
MTTKTPPEPGTQADEQSLRQTLSQACLSMQQEGLDSIGLLNLSHRWARSGAAGLITTAGQLCWHPMQPLERASDSWLNEPPAPGLWHELHVALLTERPDTHCIMLFAPPYATALACLPRVQTEGIPPFHPALAALGGDHLPCAALVGKRVADGPRALIDSVLEATASRQACLLANHGALVTGTSVAQTLQRARRLESLARVFSIAAQLGEPALLDASQMNNSFDAWQISD